MNTIPHWLQRWAAAHLRPARPRAVRRPRPRPLALERLEDRNVPGSTVGLTSFADASPPQTPCSQSRSTQDDATTSATTQDDSTQSSSAQQCSQSSSTASTTAQSASTTSAATQDGSTAWTASQNSSTASATTQADSTQSGSMLGGAMQASMPAQGGSLSGGPSAPSSGYRPINEVGNNVANPTWGTAGTDLLRVSPVAYADGVSAPSLPNNPSARVISDVLNNQNDPNNPGQDLNTVDQNSLSDFGYVWGQFIDHDMDLTPTNANNTLQILADPNDPSQMGNQTFARSVTDPATGTSTSNPAQQVNVNTSFLDLSNVYGSTQAVADALRTFSDGQMKTSPGNMLPYNNLTYFTQDQLNALNMANDAQAVPSTSLFAAGDVRANENVELTALQTLFVRNHNLIASELQKEHPTWSDEQLYQEARKINIAEEQYITYTQYLPDLLGPNALATYTGYNPSVNPSIATEFSTVAFRFGHSLLSGNIERHGNNGLDVAGDATGSAALSLATDFFDPNVLNPNGVIDPLTGHISTGMDPILKGDADGNANAMDLLAINEIRNLLFANGGLQDNGQDLIARDIERARDDGIGTYNQVRQAYGLPPVTSFAQITSNVQVQQELQKAYGTVDNIDPFEGGLAEDHVAGSDMGPLFTKILADQFNRLRAGDRFFYLNESWNSDELNLLRQGNTLAKVIEANTGVTNLQSDVFKFTASISGNVLTAARGGGRFSLQGVSGVTVQLEDASGSVIATTVTDAKGHYSFNQLNGVSATGDYTVRVVTPSGTTQVSSNPGTISISRGGVNVRGVNFLVERTGSTLSTADLDAALAELDAGQKA